MKKYGVLSIVITALIIILIRNSQLAKEGAIIGIKLCESTILPALLPILILTNIIIKSKCSVVFEKLFGRLCENLFKLPKCTAPAIIFGLIGGFPAGAILSNNLYYDGRIDDETLKRLMRFNFCGGLAFIITAVGQIRYSSPKIGLMLYISSVIPSILIGITNAFFVKEAPYSSNAMRSDLKLNDALIESVDSATKSVLIMSAYIILFSSLCNIFPIPNSYIPLFEITNGLFGKQNIPLDYASLFLAFGGFCIHMQIAQHLNGAYFDFLIFRIINALLSFVIMRILLFISPIEESVFSNQSVITVELSGANAGFGIIMVIGCAVLIIDIENQKLKLR